MTWAVILATCGGVDEVPPGWKTVAEIKAMTGKGKMSIAMKLKQGVAAGKIEQKKFRLRLGNCVRAVSHYRIRGESK